MSKTIPNLLLAVMGFFVLFVTDTAYAAEQSEITQGQSQSFQAQVATLIAANPNGGSVMEAQLVGLVASQANGAEAVAALMVVLGGSASAELANAVATAMEAAAPYSADDLANAVALAIANSTDPLAAAQSVVAASASLPAASQAAAGRGLAVASNTLAAAGNASVASSIAAVVAASPNTVLKGSFTSASNGAGDATQSTSNPAPPNTPVSTTPESSVSPS